MIFKASLLITLLFVTINAAGSEKDDSLNVEKKWKASACTCKPEPSWLKGVQQYNNDVVVAFGSFPRELSIEGDLVKTTFQTLVTSLIDYSNSESVILSTGANTMLEAFSRVDVEYNSAHGIINEFYRMVPILMKVNREIVTNLTTIIGSDFVDKVNNALSDTEAAFERYIEDFNAGDDNGARKITDYGQVTRSVQNLIDTIRQGRETSFSQLQLANREVQDAMVVLHFILDHITICKHGLSSCSEVVLLHQKRRKTSPVQG